MPSQVSMEEEDSPPGSPQESPRSSQTNHMSPQQRTEILRDCYTKVKALENNINMTTPTRLEPIVDEADRVNQDGTMEEKIKNSEEVVLDSEIMCSASNIIKKCSASLLRDCSNYDPFEYAEKILQHVRSLSDTTSEDSIEWTLLRKKIMSYFNKTAKFAMLLGTLRPIAKKEVVRRKTVREAQAPIKRPENVITVDKTEDSIEETVSGIKKIIKRHQKHHKEPVDFFALVLHPTSYGKTIENILHTSFLIRDGFVKFKIDEDGIPHVQESGEKGETDESKQKSNKNARNVQNVVSLNMKQWKALVEAYGITKPMIDLDLKKSKSSK